MAELNNKNQYPVAVNYLTHPLTSEGMQNIAVESGITISEALNNANYPIHNFDGLMVWVNGKPIENYANYHVYDGDIVNVRPIVKGNQAGAIISTIATIVIAVYFPPAAAAAGFGRLATGILTAALVYGSTRLIQSAFPPPEPQEIERKESYLLASTRNRARLFEALPLVIGKLRIAPDIASATFGRFEDNKQTVNQVYHFGLQTGLTLEDWRIGDTPLDDFAVTPIIYLPDASGNLPPRFNDTEVIRGSEVKAATGPLVVTTQPGSIGVEIDVQIIAYDVSGRGDVRTRSIRFNFAVYDADTGNQVFTQDFTLAGNKINESRKTFSAGELPKGQYRVEITKLGSDLNTSKGQRSFTVVAIKSTQEDNTDYKDQYRVGLEVQASNQITGTINQLTALAYDSIPVFKGGTWTIEPTDNPAWWFLWVARGKRDDQGKLLYGGGLADQQIDIAAIERFAAWCERKNLTCGMLLNKNLTVKKLLNTIARCGRGELTWGQGKLGVIWDDDQAVSVAVFSPSNIRTDTFAIDYNAEKTADEIIVNFLNKDNDYKPDSVRVPVGDTASPERPTQFQFEGCLDADMAGREARLLAAAQTELRRTITWDTDIEGIVVKRGDVVLISHDVVGWSESGRIVAGNNRQSFYVDKDLTFSSTGYVGIRTPSGKYKAFRVVSITNRQVTIATTPDPTFEMPGDNQSPPLDWLWFYDEGGKPGRAVKLTDVQVKDHNTLSFTAKDYSADYYNAETGDYVHAPVTDALKPLGNLITGVLDWETYRIDGERRTQVLALSWSPIASVNQYAVKIWNDKAAGEQTVVTDTSGARFDVMPGLYHYRISATDTITSQIYSAVGSITITGTADVAQVTEFTAEGILGGIILHWSYPDNTANMRMVRITANYTKGGLSVTENLQETYPVNVLTHTGLGVAQRVDYELVLVDSEGNESQPVTVTGISSDNIQQIIDAVQGEIDESALAQDLKTRIDKIDDVETEVNTLKTNTDSGFQSVQDDLAAAQRDLESQLSQTATTAQQGIDAAQNQITQVNNELTRNISDANAEVNQVKRDLTASIAAEADNNEALRRDLTSLIANAGLQTFAGPTAPTNGVKDGDIWYKEDADGEIIGTYRYNQGNWERATDADITSNSAAIVREQTARANSDTALGNRIDNVTSTVGLNTAKIHQEETTRTQADNALGHRIDSLTTRVGNNETKITDETTARTTADTALGNQVSEVSTKVDQNESAIRDESTARTTADSALSQRINSLDSTVQNKADNSTVNALNQRVSTAETTLDGKASASDVDTLKSSVETLFNNEDGLLANNLIYNGNFANKDEHGRPAGWYPAEGNTDYSVLLYSQTPANNVAVYSATDTTTGINSTAFAVNPGSTYKIKAKVKAGVPKAHGFYLRVYELTSDMPLGKKFVANGPLIPEGVNYASYWNISDDAAIGTDWQVIEYEYKPNNNVLFASVAALNWLGMGTTQLYIEFISAVEIPAKAYVDSQIQTVNNTITNKDQAMSRRVDTVSTHVDQVETSLGSQIQNVTQSLNTAQSSLAQRITDLTAKVNTKANSSTVSALTRRVSTAETNIDGKASASEVATLSSAVDGLASAGNLLSKYLGNWKLGVHPSALGMGTMGSSNENAFVTGAGPTGAQITLWQMHTNSAADSGGDGGFTHGTFACDSKKTYRYSIFAKQTSTNGTLYLGASQDGSTINIAGGANRNPYFWDGDLPEVNKWYLIVGYMRPDNTTADSGKSGVYDLTTGKQVKGGHDYKIKAGATHQLMRAYWYYSKSPTTKAYFYAPRVDEVNGNEPSITALLPNVASSMIDTLNASISTLNQTITTKDQARARQITQVQSSLNDKTAAIERTVETNATAVGGLESKYTVKIDNNGFVSGFGLISQSNTATPHSAFGVRADKFFIGAPARANVDAGNNKYPFVVKNGIVYLRTACIENAAITSAKIANVIQSSNYRAGQRGWRLNKSGPAEFNSDVVVNATVKAEHIVGDLVAAKAYPLQSLHNDRNWHIAATISMHNVNPYSSTVLIGSVLAIADGASTVGSLHPQAYVYFEIRDGTSRNGALLASSSGVNVHSDPRQGAETAVSFAASPAYTATVAPNARKVYSLWTRCYVTGSSHGGHRILKYNQTNIVAQLFRDGGAFS